MTIKATDNIPDGLLLPMNRIICSGKHDDPSWLREDRLEAGAVFRMAGFPTRKSEHWKYNDLSALKTPSWSIPEANNEGVIPDSAGYLMQPDHLNIVVLDGCYRPDLSSATEADGPVSVQSLRNPADPILQQLLQRPSPDIEQPFSLLNRAAWQDGIAVRIRSEAIDRRQIHLLLLHSGQPADSLLLPRIYVQAGEGCETQLSITNASLTNERCLNISALDIDIEKNARVSLCQAQSLNAASFHIGSTRVSVDRDGVFHSMDAAFGSAFSRQNMTVALKGPGADARLYGIFALSASQQADFHTRIEHQAPHARSRQICKGILDDQAVAVFNGAVKVFPGASATDGYQIHRTLLRSPHAKVFSKPELEIANDDVRCSHGATIGQLDPQQIFYLQSRGIPISAARDILARGFIEDLLFDLGSSHQRQILNQQIKQFFDGAPHHES